MKKMMSLIVSILAGISCMESANAESSKLVYNYSASITRLDYKMALKNVAKSTYVAQRFVTAKDTIKGIIILPSCSVCDADMGTSIGLNKSNGTLGYFWRIGDKLGLRSDVFSLDENKQEIPAYPMYYVVKDDNVMIDAAQFGAWTIPSSDGGYKKSEPMSANPYAWMQIVYHLGSKPENEDNVSTYYALSNKKVSHEPIYYGFLGFANSDAGYVINDGFGTVSSTKITCVEGKNETIGICEKDPSIEADIRWITIISSISGTICGAANTFSRATSDFIDPMYSGPCEITPMWDICNTLPEGQVNDAVICGTWTLKYNGSMTNSYNKAESEDEKEEIIKKAIFGKKSAPEIWYYESNAN